MKSNRQINPKIECLVNRSVVLKHPKQKKSLDRRYWAHQNYTREQIPLDRVCEETLLKGYQLVPGTFQWLDKLTKNVDGNIIEKKIRVTDGKLVKETQSPNNKGKMKEGETKTERIIKDGDAWQAQQFMIIEYDHLTEKTIPDFIETRPFIKENAWSITESIRSRYDDPDDPKCNGELRLKVGLCLPREIKCLQEREWIYDAFVEELPGCDTGSANSTTNGGLGNINGAYIKIGKIVDTGWFNSAIDAGKKKQEAEAAERAQLKQENERKQAERAAIGFIEREGELPLEALAKADPALFLESIGLSLKSESGKYQHWGRTEKQGDTALSVWQSDHSNWQIRVFANSIPVPPTVNGAMPFTRFYCYHELHTDIEGLQSDSPQWKEINAQLASRNYGSWLSDDEFRQKFVPLTQTPRNSNDIPGIEPVTTLPPDHPILNSAPQIEVRETRSFRHFSKEERIVVKEILGLSPDAGWHEGIPAFATRYENLHKITGEFDLNGQPNEVEKRRVWSTQFGKCEKCGDITADWVDRYHLTAGRYCNSCHADTPLGSYLEYELARKLPNSIVSEHQGYLGNDPEFRDFRLWQPEMMSHLGAGMATGKSTEIYKAIVSLAKQRLGIGIIASPRISLTRFLAHQLRKRHGRQAWGLWHEDSGRGEQYIGTYGAIVCLPSLGRAVSSAYNEGLDASDLYVAIDEIDFGYSLLSLAVHQATTVKKALLDIFLATGLVVSGQTESTLALEAFAAELGCDHVQGFYNTAPPADGIVEMRKYPDVDGKNALVLAGGIESIDAALTQGYNVYVFCASRRDGDVIAERFVEHSPVVYNSFTKGDPRCDAVLKNQRLPEGSRLFIGTSAAGVGISILDPKAKTIRVGGLNHGSRDASMGVQTTLRDRGRKGIEWHFVDYNFALPIRPRETERVSLYHEEIKQLENQYAHLSENAVKKVARSLALSTLADHQPETFVKYHLGEVGNMSVVETQALLPDDSEVEWVTEHRREAIKNERKTKCKLAIEILTNRDLMTSREIRVQSNRNAFSQTEQIAHEYANGLARAVGWNDADGVLGDTDIEVAIALAKENVQPERLEKLRRGYLAVHYPNWVTFVFEKELEETTTDNLNAGIGRELTSVTDDRFLGVVLKALIDRLKEEVFSDTRLANAIREVLDTVSHGQTLFGRIKQGGLGANAYRRARFLNTAGDTYVIHWARTFIKEFYPATLSKRKDRHSLVHDKRTTLILSSFKSWLSQRIEGEVPELMIGFDELEPQDDLKEQVRDRRKAGALLETIASEFNISIYTASKWCEEIETLSPTETEVMGVLEDGQVWKTSDIHKNSTFTRQAVTIAIKNLLDKGFLTKRKRGHYQKSDV